MSFYKNPKIGAKSGRAINGGPAIKAHVNRAVEKYYKNKEHCTTYLQAIGAIEMSSRKKTVNGKKVTVPADKVLRNNFLGYLEQGYDVVTALRLAVGALDWGRK